VERIRVEEAELSPLEGSLHCKLDWLIKWDLNYISFLVLTKPLVDDTKVFVGKCFISNKRSK